MAEIKLTISEELYDKLKEEAKELGVSVDELILSKLMNN